MNVTALSVKKGAKFKQYNTSGGQVPNHSLGLEIKSMD